MAQTSITSLFGYRTNPFEGTNSEFHNGYDFSASMGTPVYVSGDGVVSEMGVNKIFGLMVLVDHGNGYSTLYGHLSVARVERGQKLIRGMQVGDVGSTGRSTGPHLHYSVYHYGIAVDPAPFLTGQN